MRQCATAPRGFTLIEMAIVLVIIGLIVGGVLVGQNLIAAAGARAIVTQIEKFNTAVNTFYGKYGALPGDLNQQVASQFGFTSRGQYAGEGDGNGVIEGISTNAPASNNGLSASTGEAAQFWVDLSTAKLIPNSFSTASPSVMPTRDVTLTTAPSIPAYLPPSSNAYDTGFIYVYSYTGVNYFGLSAVSILYATGGGIYSVPSLTVAHAYAVDKKIDDGFPQLGSVKALYVNSYFSASPIYAVNIASGHRAAAADTSPTGGDSYTCFDNGLVAGATQRYSVEQNNGSGVNCALSFQMQAGD